MKINVHEEKKIETALLIQVSGKIEAGASRELSQAFDKYIKRGRRNFILDLQDVEYIDSSGIGVLVKAWKMLRNENGQIVFRNISKSVDHLLTLNGLKDVFNIK